MNELFLTGALALRGGEVVSLVGAGGKTAAAFRLSEEWASSGGRAVFTTTTKIMEPIPGPDECLFLMEGAGGEEEALKAILRLLELYPRLILAGRRLSEEDHAFLKKDRSYPIPVRANKLGGISPALVDRLACALRERLEEEVLIVVEADGARHRLLKAPAPYEPVLPSSTGVLVPVADLAVLGRPLNEENVHRSLRVAALTGLAPGEPVSAEAVARGLAHPEGGLKCLPQGARAAALLHQRAPGEPDAGARQVAGLLLKSGQIERVVVAALRARQPVLGVFYPPVAAIILAAGASARMGRPKQLLPFGGKPMLRRVVETVLASPAEMVFVVLGHRAEEMRAALAGLPVQVVFNSDWERGLSSSLRAGLKALPPYVRAALFVLADQPNLTASLLARLIAHHRQSGAPIVLPISRRERGNPVLFDRTLFPELMSLEGDVGGRMLIERHPNLVAGVEISYEEMPADIDTPEDYFSLRGERWLN